MADPRQLVQGRLRQDSTRSRRPSRSYESAPAWSFARFSTSRSARARAALEHLGDALALDHDHAVRVEHDGVALPDRRAADLDRLADRARRLACRRRARGRSAPRSAARARAAPRRRGPQRRRGRRDAAPRACVASSSPTRATGAGSGIVSTSTSPGSASAIAACTIRLSPWPQRTVRAGPAAREPGMIWTSGRSTTALRAAASCTVAEPRRASSRIGLAHSSSTTCGVTRWNASANRMRRRSRTSGARGCRAARRAGRSRSAGTTAPSSPPSPHASARSPT